MSEKTREVKKFQDAMYTQSLYGETIYSWMAQWPEYEDRLRQQSWGTSLVFYDITS